MELTVIRHLPTEWNKKGILQGKKDISISDVTREIDQQICRNKLVLQNVAPFDCVLSSTLKRTNETAAIYDYHFVQKEPFADELDFGAYEGISKQELIRDQEKEWFQNPYALKLGENLAHFENRIVHFLDKYKHFSNLLLFGHGSWIRGMASIKECGMISIMNKIEVPNNALIKFSFSKKEIDKLLFNHLTKGGLCFE